MVGPVSWNGPGGSAAALVTRVSTTRAGSPVAPVVSRTRSSGAMSLSSAAWSTVWNGGAVVRGALGAPDVLGGGSTEYGVLLSGATKNAACGAAWAWAASAKFGPGVPSALMMPLDNRL